MIFVVLTLAIIYLAGFDNMGIPFAVCAIILCVLDLIEHILRRMHERKEND